MANVVNLGRVSRRESPLSGLSTALSQGLTIGVNADTLRQRERERKTREKREDNLMSSKLASQELREREQDLKNIRKTHDQFSMWWNGMDAQEKSIAKTSDQYKEMQKFFKSFNNLVPGLVKDNGDIVAATSKDIFKKKLDERTAQAKLNMASGKATEEDIQLLRLTEGDKEKVAAALNEAADKFKKGGDKNAIMEYLKSEKVSGLDIMQGRNEPPQPSRLGSLFGPSGVTTPQITQPQAPVSSNVMGIENKDPLGILGR